MQRRDGTNIDNQLGAEALQGLCTQLVIDIIYISHLFPLRLYLYSILRYVISLSSLNGQDVDICTLTPLH